MSKVALVTGATGGIGRAIALDLAKQGFDIGINYRSSLMKAEQLQKEIEMLGQNSVLLQGDLTSSDNCNRIVEKCIDELGGIYALINNAGITKDTLAMRMTDDEFTCVIEGNLNSCFYMTRATMRHMLKKREGRIVNVSSVIGITGNGGQSNYAASKAGIIGFSKSCAKEVAKRGICVNVVAPGYIKTPMTEVLSDDVKKAISSKIPLKRLGEPEDVAGLVSFLCSENSSYITGQVMVVDGGMVI